MANIPGRKTWPASARPICREFGIKSTLPILLPQTMARREVKAQPTSTQAISARCVVVDSGPMLALFNGADHWNSAVLEWLQANPQITLLTTWPVLTEVCAMLARRVSNTAALDFLRWGQREGFTLDAPAPQALPDALAQVLLISEGFHDLPFDLADASVAEAAARLGLRHLLCDGWL